MRNSTRLSIMTDSIELELVLIESSTFVTDDIILMNDIQNKINNHLQNALSVCLIKFSSLDKLKIFLQDVNNKQ